MMYLFKIRGEEGRTLGDARLHQPTCYSHESSASGAPVNAVVERSVSSSRGGADLAGLGLFLIASFLYKRRGPPAPHLMLPALSWRKGALLLLCM